MARGRENVNLLTSLHPQHYARLKILFGFRSLCNNLKPCQLFLCSDWKIKFTVALRTRLGTKINKLSIFLSIYFLCYALRWKLFNMENENYVAEIVKFACGSVRLIRIWRINLFSTPRQTKELLIVSLRFRLKMNAKFSRSKLKCLPEAFTAIRLKCLMFFLCCHRVDFENVLLH